MLAILLCPRPFKCDSKNKSRKTFCCNNCKLRYIEKILHKLDHFEGNGASTPIDPSIKISKNKGDSVSPLDYSRSIRCLMYIMNNTIPNIAYVVSKLSRYANNPSEEHQKAIIQVFKYLKKTVDYGLHYEKYPAVLKGYSNTNWISDSEESKSASMYLLLVMQPFLGDLKSKHVFLSPQQNQS